MIKISNVTLIKDSGMERMSVMYDELTDDGKTISVNNRVSRIVTDEATLEAISVIDKFAGAIIEED